MEESEQYKNKIESMQKYVPLLSKLIKQLEEICGCTPESTEKINQLKILQQQLCDPKPGILLDELNKCEKVLGNLFDSEDNKNGDEDQTIHQSNEKTEEAKETTIVVCKEDIIVTLNEGENSIKIEKECTEQSEKFFKPKETDSFESNQELNSPSDVKDDKNLVSQTTIPTALQDNNQEMKTISDELSYLESNISSDADEKEKNCNKAQDHSKEEFSELANFSEPCNSPQKDNAKEIESTDESFEESSVEIIEFFQNESGDDGELIVPDEESLFIDKSFDVSDENQDNFEQYIVDEKLKENFKSSQELDAEINKEDCIKDENVKQNIHEQIEHRCCNQEFSNDENVEKELNKNSSNSLEINANTKSNDLGLQKEEETNIGPAENNESKEQNVQTKSSVGLVQSSEQQKENNKMKTDECVSNQNGQKRTANECSDESIAKKQKISQLNGNNEECNADPLAIDNERNTNSIESPDCTYDNNNDDVEIIEQRRSIKSPDCSYGNNNDDVEIIEQYSSPILIDSDDDDKLIEPNQKMPIKRAAFAFKSTNPNKIRDKELKNYVVQKSNPNIYIGNKKIAPIPVLKQNSKSKVPKAHTQQKNFLSNIDLQPSQLNNPNPRHFKTHLGEKAILIPNAFYGSPSYRHTIPAQSKTQNSNADSDAAHCRWLNNFLHHFCIPREIAHNTCYLLFQRALRQEDFERIYHQRQAMKPTDNHMNIRLLCQLRNIFYVGGNQMMQKLTFIGRKFCQSAFLNILDKTISLTTDSVTNTVTSRTRISAATLEAARVEILNSKTAATKATLLENDFKSQNIQISTISKAHSAIIPGSQSSSTLRKRREDDTEYCPPRDLTQESAECPLRRSLRNTVRRQSTCENSRSFTYSETEEDENILNIEPNHQEHEKREKPNLTAATEAYITQKRLAAKQERQKLAKSFEADFIENVSNNEELNNSEHHEVSMSSTSKQFHSTLSTENNSDIFVISDDDDIQEVEPKPHLIYKNSNTNITKDTQPEKNGVLRNISTDVHSMSKFNDYCLLCNRPISRVVGHYVNTHSNDEVFVSRPSPQMARTMLSNKLDQAAYDRLQNGLNLYIATCVFCEKKGSFTLPYWYQHFASHTGEYAYRCTGCGLKKPTRSQLSLHVRQNCNKNGGLEVTQEYDLSLFKINGYTCRICYYTQLNLRNVLRHLKNQHKLLRVDKCHWADVTLLDVPKSIAKGKNLINTVNTSQSTPIYVQSGDNDIFEIAEVGDVDDYTGDNSGQPIVVNEAECNDDWYGDPSDVSNNIPFISSHMDYPTKHE